MKRSVGSRIDLKKPTAALGALAAAISALHAPVTFAAESAAVQLDEIVVSARRREEMAQDVPISMTVMTAEFLESNSIESVQDLGTKVPSMRISAAGGSVNEPIISLRGQRQGEATFNQDPAAPIYFNEIVIAPTQGSNMGLYDLEGLQVLKGPQGTLFGRNSTGGAMLVTPTRPGSELGGYVEVKAGDYNLWGFEGAVDVPIYDKLTTRIAAHKLDRDGYQENIADNALHGRDYRDEHSQGARLSVNFATGAFNTLTVFAYDENHMSAAVPVVGAANPQANLGQDAEYQGLVAEQVARDNPWKVKSDVDGEEAVRNIFFSNTSEYEINDDVTIKNVFGYRNVHFASANDTDGTAKPYFGAVTAGAVTFDPRLSTVDTEFYSNELQLFGTSLDGQLDWLGGLYWSKLQGTEDKLIQQAPNSYDSGLNDILNTSYGIMAESTYSFTDEWSFTAGARNSWDKREITVRKWNTIARNGDSINFLGNGCGIYAEGVVPTVNPIDPRLPGVGTRAAGCERTVDDKFEKPTFKFSLNYKPEANTLVYGSVATGYRAGGFNTRGTTDTTLQPYDQENVVTYELGHKKDWDFSGVSVRTSVAAYFQNYQDIQNTVSFDEGGRLVTRTENAGKAEISGLEFEFTVKPTDNLRFDASYSYIDAKFTKRESTIDPVTVAGSSDAFTIDTTGDDFSYIPKQSLTASTTYTLPLDAKIGEVSLTAGVYWQDEMTTHPLKNEFNLYGWSAATVDAMTKFSEVDAYSVYNLRANWRSVMSTSFDVAVYVNNVTDEEYVLGGLNVVESGGYGAYHYGDPRTIGASVKYSF